MKCDSFVLWVDARRKGSGAPYRRVKETVSWWGTRDLGIRADKAAKTSAELLAAGYVLCDGQIKATIRAVDEPEWGYTHAVLNFDLKCDKCGQTYFPEINQDEETASALVTAAIAGIVPAEQASLRKRRLGDRENSLA